MGEIILIDRKIERYLLCGQYQFIHGFKNNIFTFLKVIEREGINSPGEATAKLLLEIKNKTLNKLLILGADNGKVIAETAMSCNFFEEIQFLDDNFNTKKQNNLSKLEIIDL